MRGIHRTTRRVAVVVLWLTTCATICLTLGIAAPRTARAGCGDYLLHERRQSYLNELAHADSRGGESGSEQSVPSEPVRSRCSAGECSPAPASTTRSSPVRVVERLDASMFGTHRPPAVGHGRFASRADCAPTREVPGRVFRPPRNRVEPLYIS